MHNKYYFNNCYFNDIHIDGFNHLSKHDDYWIDGRGKVHERLYRIYTSPEEALVKVTTKLNSISLCQM
ncbi:hypothetical protein PRIPAC_79428 [Pristionchus pacificus]|uniref:Uncharacterized protein n=1 Tax=Pristionchus pacificus TaxID=54126 RepID=A0A2A6C3V1_PRIPA|nr:hypothetical protein PRIPAC_79428 [Pristionchus pacificus]|eukprot:PDM72723.1 hypothetical protein PRIPAC_39157 [Pristionchus pacificus]